MRIGFDVKFWLCGAVLLCGMAAHAGEAAYGRVIVKLKADASVLRSSVVLAQQAGANGASNLHAMQRLGQRRGLSVQDGRDMGGRMHVATASGMSSEALAASLARDSDVEYAVPDRWRKPLAVNDPLYGGGAGHPFIANGQWYLQPHTNTSFSGDPLRSAIDAENAWNTATGAGITVAVVDSGVRFDHPDLMSKLLPGYNMISYAAVSGTAGRGPDASDLGDGVTQTDLDAIRAINPDIDCELKYSDWHGTKVAGIIGAATGNGVGMASVAPDAMLLPVRVLGKCGGWDSDILDGMRWAAGLNVGSLSGSSTPARVINLSLGGEGACTQPYISLIAELAAYKIIVVASAGNDDGLKVSMPGNCPGVVTVTSVRHLGTKAGYSSVGPEVSISAPGGNCVNTGASDPCLFAILSTRNTGSYSPVADADGGSSYMGSSVTYLGTSTPKPYGTSFSAPQVSGVIALMLQKRSDLTPAAVASLLRATARAFPTTGVGAQVPVCHVPNGVKQDECYCTSATCGAGMLDANAAVHAAQTSAAAVIETSPVSPAPGQPLALSGTASMSSPSPGASNITSYQWTLLDGGGIVSSSGWPSSGGTVTVHPTAAGMFRVRLTVQDNLGQSASTDRWIVVSTENASSTQTSSSGGGGGGGGGGGVDDTALAGLACLLAWACVQARRAQKPRHEGFKA